jgi:peptidoglycan/xylan/chitin deacetylase (PgdA/CDA1 family)
VKFRSPSIPVLMYHRIGPPQPNMPPSLTVSAERFRQQADWLARHQYTAISLEQWQSALEGKLHRPVLLTFDDAYADLCEHAFPILREYGFHATVFVVSSLLGGINEWDVKQGCAACPLMSAEQILYWSTQGIEFGAHTRTHPPLTNLTDAVLTNEIEGSRHDLAALLGRPVRAFAYPFGYSNQAVRRCAARKYELAFTCDGGLNRASTDPHHLRRSMVQPHDSLADFALRVRFGYAPIAGLRSQIRLRTRLRTFFGSPVRDLA